MNIVIVLVSMSIFFNIAIIAFVIRVPIIIVFFFFFFRLLHSRYGQCFNFLFLAIDLIRLVWKISRDRFFFRDMSLYINYTNIFL